MDVKEKIKNKFKAIEAQMKAKLSEIRSTLSHPGDKGASLEKAFRDFLREYLPFYLRVGYGEIIDKKGHESKQIDVVVANEFHPFTFTENSPGLFFIEGVCAVGEIKTSLNTKEIENILNNSYVFKQLETSPIKHSFTASNPSDLNRFYKNPPYFAFAFESPLNLETILENIKRYLQAKKLPYNAINKIVDAIFILDKGWLINFGDGQGSFRWEIQPGKFKEGWFLKYSSLVLFDFMGWLHTVMPRIIYLQPILPFYLFPTI